jgi:predicted dehydrogenase
LVRYESGAIGQFEVSWTFRGGMDLRDEIAGTEGTIWLNHWLRTGFEMFTSVGQGGYVAEKAEGDTGWLFPVGDEVVALGYVDMFRDMFASMDRGSAPMETFYDGYIVNAIIDASYKAAKSKKWEPIVLDIWRGAEITKSDSSLKAYDENHYLVKEEVMPDGRTKLILKEKSSGLIIQKFVE